MLSWMTWRLFVRLLCGLLVGAAALAIVLLVGLGIASGPAHPPASSQPNHSGSVAPLQAVESPTTIPTPAGFVLSPQQIDCLNKFFDGVDGFRRLNHVQQEGTLVSIGGCVAAELGIPYVPPTPLPGVVGFQPQDIRTPFPTKLAGAGAIVDGGANGPSHLGAHLLRFFNAWREDFPWGSITVWAGNEEVENPTTFAVDSSQGAVVVNGFIRDNGAPTPPAGLDPDPKIYYAPGKHGAVKIVDAVGDVLKLQAEDGTIYFFAVASRQFVATLPSIPLPSSTPQP